MAYRSLLMPTSHLLWLWTDVSWVVAQPGSTTMLEHVCSVVRIVCCW